MFPSLKCSSLRSRPRHKGIAIECVSAEPKDRGDMKISCSPNFKCQDSFEKFTHCSSQNDTRATHRDYRPVANHPDYFNTYKDYSDSSIHSDAFTQNTDKYRYSSDDDFSEISSTTKVMEVILERDEDNSLGITLQGGIHPNVQYSRPIYVTYVKPDGPADREGTIQTGDRLLAIDGYSLADVTLSETHNLLQQLNNRSMARLTIEYDVTIVGDFVGPMLVEMESPRAHQLGLTLTNTPYNAAVLIDEIRPGSISERCGALHPGDQILAVNNTRVESSKMAATEVYKLLRLCGGVGNRSSLVMEILPFYIFSRNQSKAAGDFGQCDYYNLPFASNYLSSCHSIRKIPVEYNSIPQHYDVPNVQPRPTNTSKQMTLTLHSNDKVGYGLSVFCLPNNPKIIIHSLIPESPADKSEVLQIGDEIITANECPLTGVTSDPQPLHKVPGIPLGSVTLQIEYGVNKRSISNDDVISIALNKYNNRNLGITVADYKGYLMISDMKAGSVADRNGALSVGDKILSINNHPVIDCTVEQVSNMLNEELDSVVLEIQKKHPEEDNAVEYTVELNKQGGNLGITVTGSDSTPREIVISVIIPGGLAEKTGALHVGDRVLAIDNNDTSSILLSEAMNYLQNSKDCVLIKVSRSHLTSSDATAVQENNTRAYGSPGLYSVDSAIESWESSQEPSSSNEIPFHRNDQMNSDYKTDDGDTITEEHILPSLAQHTTVNNELRYGTMRSQVRHGSRSNSPCYRPNNTSVEPHINSVGTNRSASCSRSVPTNTRPLETDGSSLEKNVDLIFKIADIDEEGDRENEVYRVTLYKDPLYDDFGFSVSDGLYERGVFINRIRQGGPADNCGLLRPLDKIVQVNGTKTDNFDCCLTVPLVASTGNKVTLKIVRKRASSINHNTQVR